jgi:LuxR family maltose regulon positive regulatory protein
VSGILLKSWSLSLWTSFTSTAKGAGSTQCHTLDGTGRCVDTCSETRKREAVVKPCSGRNDLMSVLHMPLTKFTIPSLRPALLSRPSLITRLNQSRQLPLVLLSAGAGFGKTTLLSAWASQSPNPVAWLSLESQENDPVRFWTALIVALCTRRPSICGGALPKLGAQGHLELASVLTSLINDLDTDASEITLILDDYHFIEERSIHSQLAFLVEHAPSNLHVMLSSRVDPALPLSRLRARGQLLELRDADLRLSEAETDTFLSQTMSVHLPEAETRRLAERTEGWIAGVQLVALALANARHDPIAFLKGFTGTHRFILDYVQEEILAPQPAAVRHFLLHTAVLTQMHADLCQQLSGEQGAQDMLEALERANLFLVPLDDKRQWYRFHALFREVLLARLRMEAPELERSLHERAARWYEAHNLLQEAIPHALAANNAAYAADLLECFLVPQTWRNEYHLLRRWLARLPPEVLRVRPHLSLASVLATLYTSRREADLLSQVEEPLQWAEQGYREAGNQAGLGAVLTVRATLAGSQGAFSQALSLAREASDLLPEQERQWRGQCLSILGAGHALSGQLAQAQPLLLQGLTLLESTGSLTGMQFALAFLGDVCLSQGDLHQALHYVHRGLAVSDEQPGLTHIQLMLSTGDRYLYYERLSLYERAALAYEWNRLEEAERYLHLALPPGRFVWTHILAPGLLLQVRLLLAQGEAQQARTMLGELMARETRSEVRREIHFCQAWLSLKLEDLAPVQRWRTSYTQEAEPLARSRLEEEVLLLARLSIAEGQPEEALARLEPWKREAKTLGRRLSELEILVTEALAHARNGAGQEAERTLQEAVALAYADGYQRLFLDEGQPMEALLKALLKSGQKKPISSYVRGLLRAFAVVSGHPGEEARAVSASDSDLFEPLTPQEARVLRLLAEGASNQEIANALVIEYSTAKKHVANILSKLGAQSRTQAIALARDRALL